MRRIGFSTGALAKGDFRRGIEMQAGVFAAIELSALRDHELAPFIEAIPNLPLDGFDSISVHAPGKLGQLSEEEAVRLLTRVPAAWPIVVHPEIVVTPEKWTAFGAQLCLENMDNRKTRGRTVDEMREWFAALPDARFCLDLGHARQIDPTMSVALRMLTEFADRLVQLHVSDVGPAGEHLPIRALAALAFGRVAHRVPSDCAIIIESIVTADEMRREEETVRRLFAPAATFAA